MTVAIAAVGMLTDAAAARRPRSPNRPAVKKQEEDGGPLDGQWGREGERLINEIEFLNCQWPRKKPHNTA